MKTSLRATIQAANHQDNTPVFIMNDERLNGKALKFDHKS